MARFFLPCARALAVRCLGQHGGWWRTSKHEHAEPRRSVGWAHDMELFAAMVRPIETATAILIAALKKDCGARGCARRTSKTCFSRARRRARPFFCPFGQYFDGVSTKPRCARLRKPKFRTGQRVRSLALDVNVRQNTQHRLSTLDSSCSARRGEQVIALDVNIARERGLLGSSTRQIARTPVTNDQNTRYFVDRSLAPK